jgi:hypothetical protein
MGEPQHGAYGFRLRYPWDSALEDLVTLCDDAPIVDLCVRQACSARTFDSSDSDSAAMGRRGGSAFAVTRTTRRIVFDVPEIPSADILLHPLATVPLAILARWRGDVTLHAGAFAVSGHAWVLLGSRHSGKSTTLALAARRGLPVLADDLVVVSDGRVLAGPRSVDLREDAAARLGATRDLGDLGSRRRFRVSSPPGPASAPLGGFLLLDWHEGDEVLVERLTAAERVRSLYSLEYVALVGPADPQKILDLAAAPAFRIRRPRSWSASESMLDRLLAVTGASPTMRTAAG